MENLIMSDDFEELCNGNMRRQQGRENKRWEETVRHTRDLLEQRQRDDRLRNERRHDQNREAVGVAVGAGLGLLAKAIFNRRPKSAQPAVTGPAWWQILGLPPGIWDWDSDDIIDNAYHAKKNETKDMQTRIALSAAHLEGITLYH
jgi:hypothetical protein